MVRREERLAKGLCPNCGEEAAPYYLCQRCHEVGQIRKFLVRAGKEDRVLWQRDPKDRRRKLWWKARADWADGISYGGAKLGARRSPRLNRIPVDVERELIAILERAGRPLHIDEIMAAWGRLRLRRGRGSVAVDLAHIIAGRKKQAAKLARRAERARRFEASKVAARIWE